MTPAESRETVQGGVAAPAPAAKAGRPGGPRAGALRPWHWWALGSAATAVLAGVVVAGLVSGPGSPLFQALLATAPISGADGGALRGGVDDGASRAAEYLVFLRESSPAARNELFAGVPGMAYVTDSILPQVVVVRFTPDRLTKALAAARAHAAVRLVVKYDPSFACH